MFDRGFSTLFSVRGIPVRAHWSLPLGLLVFSGARFAPGLWVAILAIILLHELGHAFVVHRVGLVTVGIDLTGFGGVCRWVGDPSRKERAMVAWGGVLAQLGLLVVAAPLWLALTPTGVGFVDDLLYAFVVPNLVLVALNLLPFGGLDGKEAWPLLGMLREERRRRREWKRKLSRAVEEPARPQTLREALEEADRRR